VSQQQQVVEIRIDQTSEAYSCKEVFSPYNPSELPYKEPQATIVNSEDKFSCWSIENPHSKQLHKSLTLKMGPNTSQEFIIVLKVPAIKKSTNLASFINVRLRTQESVEQEEIIEKHLRRVNSQLSDVELKEKKRSLKTKNVLIVGKLDNPRIQCVKVMEDKHMECQVIPLAIKKAEGQQKFRIPFKNTNPGVDSEIDFSFVRAAPPRKTEEEEEPKKEITDFIDFVCQPSTLKLGGGQQGLLNVVVKVNFSKMKQEMTEKEIAR
jgi:hypothetical protein